MYRKILAVSALLLIVASTTGANAAAIMEIKGSALFNWNPLDPRKSSRETLGPDEQREPNPGLPPLDAAR